MNEKIEQNKTKRLQVTLPEKMIENLDDIAGKYNISKSNIISMLIKKYAKEEFGNFEN